MKEEHEEGDPGGNSLVGRVKGLDNFQVAGAQEMWHRKGSDSTNNTHGVKLGQEDMGL